MNRERAKKNGARALFWGVIILALLVLLLPIYYMISASFKTQAQMLKMSQFFIFTPTFANFVKIFTRYSLTDPLVNSLLISIAATFFASLLGLPAAYSIARHKQTILSAIILAVRIVPAISFLIPWYVIFSRIGIIGTHWALILSNLLVLLPLMIWIVSPYFGSIPKELEESAFIDGCTEAASFVRIMVPLAVPGILTAAILSFIFSWNKFMFALILGGVRTKTLPVMIYNFVGYTFVDLSGMMAAAVVITMPVVLLSIFLQKYVVSGLTAGAVKG